MKRTPLVPRTGALCSASTALFLTCLSFIFFTVAASAGTKTWDGQGLDSKWQTPANWVGNVAPSAGDSLIFTGTSRLLVTNDYPVGTTFNGISFVTPAAAFVVSGNGLTDTGDIADNQTVLTETLNLPITLGATPNLNVSSNCFLTLSGPVSGGFGLTKIGGGTASLLGTNSFTGALTINAGTVFVPGDTNLGFLPPTPTPGTIAINGGASLRTTNTFNLSTNRGIALGPGTGTIDVGAAATLTYRGTLADSLSGPGGLAKLSFGGLTLAGSNTYSGPTVIENGTITLDFTQGTSPPNNIINPVSSLTLGGANAGFGATNAAVLLMTPKGTNSNSQTFDNTHVTFGGSVIQVTSNNQANASLSLGLLDHDPGGVLVAVTPKLAGLAGNNISTTATNVNGILGGWATISGGTNLFGITIGTNFACVDGSGNIINFSNYLTYASGSLHSQIGPATNLLINSTTSGDIVVDADNAGTTNDVNTLNVRRWENGGTTAFSLIVGAGNTLRLGKFGAIFKSDSAQAIWLIGETAGGANGPDQNIGTLTAGGAPNTPGEIVVDVNNTSESTGTTIIDTKVADNGTGQVTFVKTGPGSMKLRGHNTYSGGTFLLQGRVQFVGGEGGVGTGNADAGGTGPIYILPGCYLFPSGTGPTTPVTNQVFSAGNGTVGEPLGAIRGTGGWLFTGPWTLIGDTTIGGNGGVSGALAGPISGAFQLGLCSPATVNGSVCLANPNNSWTGNTTMNGRNTSANTFLNGTNDCIPNGFGFGNVFMSGLSGGTITWDLNGFNETINGFATIGNGPSCLVQNGTASTVSTLAIGDNDQSGTFSGTIQDGAGQVALTKVGAGLETLTATNTYSGITTVSNGTLALTGTGAIVNSRNLIVNGGTLDISALTFGTAFGVTNAVSMTNGVLFANPVRSVIPSLSMNDSTLTLVVDTQSTNIAAGSFSTGGSSNVINISAVANVPGYPAFFPIVSYSGSIGGAGDNFAIGTTPNNITVGYVSNDVPHSTLVLVLLNGPKPLTWVGNDPANPTFWDLNVTTNWLAFKGFPSQTNSTFNTADSTFFDDTASTNVVNVIGSLVAGGITVSNNAVNYTFMGSGNLSGTFALQKLGTGSLTLLENGGDAFRNGVVVTGGGTLTLGADNGSTGGSVVGAGSTLQIGVGAGAGTLPSGNANVDGSLIFDRGADLTVNNNILGAGGISKIDANILTLGGNNSYTGAVTVVSGTLKTASASALGATNDGTTISAGATLDVNGQNLGTEPVTVSGAGVGANGAIINSGGGQNNALRLVTLTADSTVGGTGRWDIRESAVNVTDASLTGAFNLTKIGTNQFSLGGVNVDSGLGNINVTAGIFSYETGTTGLGDNTKTLTIATNATFELSNPAQTLAKPIVLNGNGLVATVNNASGTNIVASAITITGSNIWTINGTSLTLNSSSSVGGGGNITMNGGGILDMQGSISYSGNTVVKSGTLFFDTINTGGGTLTNAAGSTVGGVGGNAGPFLSAGIITPGNGQSPANFVVGNMAVTNTTMTFKLIGDTDGNHDQITALGNLVLAGTNTITVIPSLGSLHTNTVIPLITYTGTLTGSTNNIKFIQPPIGFSFVLTNTSVEGTNAFALIVNHVPADLTWKGGAVGNPNLWDLTVSNWSNGGNPALFGTGDHTTFDDTATTGNITLTNAVQPIQMDFVNGHVNYVFSGAGKITGTTAMNVNGGATVTFANSGGNDFTNAINMFAGNIQVGIGGTNGSLGSGLITDTTDLIFNRSDNISVSNVISSGGNPVAGIIDQKGPGILTMFGNNVGYGGTVLVEPNATLRLGNGNAMGTNGDTPRVFVFGTLDIGTNNINIGVVQISAAGAGVNGTGAIVNNSGSSGFVAPNFAYVTMTNDLTIGGTGRLDWRSNPATSNLAALTISDSQPHKLIKVGTNLLQAAGVQFDPNLGDIQVQAGTFGIQGLLQGDGLGNATNSCTVYSNATLSFFAVSNVMNKVLVVNNGGIVANSSGINIWGGPTTLSGSNLFNVTGTWLSMSNVVSGNGMLVVTGTATMFLPYPEAYTGPTVVEGGTLALTNNPDSGTQGSITTSPSITVLSAGTLDASGRTDGTLGLVGQTLSGAGTVKGFLVADSASTVAPGSSSPAATGRLTVSTNATLGGQTIMKLTKTPLTNDVLRTTGGSITYGGALIVTNVSTVGNLTGGETFKLFSAGNSNYLGSFSSVTLPPLASGLLWNNNLAANGTISVSGTLASRPNVTSFSFLSPTLSLSGSGGIPFGNYVVVGSTNVAKPLGTWTPIVTNSFDGSGNFNWSGNVGTNAMRFFTIRE
jgi:fibronectin-binding autotransporter adhesin